MSKKAIFIFIIIFLVFFIIGCTIQNNRTTNKVKRNSNQEDTVNIIDDTETIEVNTREEKTTPNTVMILKKRYKDCGHEVKRRATIPEEMVNLTKYEIAEIYPNWILEGFSKDEIILTKEVDSFCGEHYLLIEENGEVNIYSVDEEGKKSFKKKTDVTLDYLPETDRITLKNGLMVYGTENLNRVLEDYEV